MGTEILVVINVRLNFDARDSADCLCVFLMERELDISLAELNLFEA